MFGLLCVLVIGGVITFALYTRSQRRRHEDSAAPPMSDSERQLAEIRRQPYLMFRNTALGPAYGQLSLVPLNAPDGVRYGTGLTCERVYGNSRSGLCLQAVREVFPTFKAVSFNSMFQAVHVFDLAGEPSRARVSADGRLAAATVFISGHGYSGVGFSTRAAIFDLVSSTTLVDNLENFTVTKDGQPFRKTDFNFWGVTFAKDDDRFYATLASAGINYLVEGSVSGRLMRVLRQGVECPSLAPDGQRLVFKSRVVSNTGPHWQLHVWNLKTGSEITINESRSVDDQAEWLDADHVLYGLPRNIEGSASWDIWTARADGTGMPRRFVSNASSPCVVRPGMEAASGTKEIQPSQNTLANQILPPSASSTAIILQTSNFFRLGKNAPVLR